MKKGHSFKDWLCPDSMEFQKDHFRIDERWGRVLYLQDYATYIKDSMIAELCDMDRSLMLSIDVLPVPTDEAVREIQNKLLGVETNAANWQRKQNAANNFSAVLPYDMEQQRKETKEMLDDLTNRDQRMMFGLVTLVHLADAKEQLDSDTETILTVARKHLCQMSTLRWQQKDGLDTVLPYGLRKIHALRTLTTESTAVLIPFRAQEILQGGGIYYGQNAVSKNMIVADRRRLLNGNSFRLGVSGSGKSFSAKEEIVSIALSTDDDILILDPESEFGFLTEALGGEVIRVSASSNTHINALDMDKAYGDERNPLIEKSEFILSLFEQLVGAGGVSAKEKSILDRCTYDVYREYMANNYQGEVPTLKDLYHSLLKQPEPEARGLALSSELFITGSLNTFAQPTNVDTKARIIAYDIRELGEQLMPIGMLVTLDAIFNRVIQNWKKGKTTWVFADEFYLLFRYQYSADFFYKLWKRIRKYNGLVTGLTQNVEELLRSDTARLMLANSEFLILLNQSATDRDELAGLLHISDTQLGYITNVSAGCGLIRCAGNIVPFENSFPRNTRLYQLMTTKPDEALRGGVTIEMIMDRFWAMPSKYTFEIKPIRELLMQYMPNGLVIDPFANKSKLASVTNDLDTNYDTDFHLDATDFLAMFQDASVDMVLYDPPYSARQVSECYRKMGHTVNMQTTQNSYWRKHKEQIRRIVKPNGLVISCGWNSGGIGKKYGFEPLHIRLVAHGGNHNDTIVVVERRTDS